MFRHVYTFSWEAHPYLLNHVLKGNGVSKRLRTIVPATSDYSAVPTFLSLRLCFKRVFSSSLSYEFLFNFQGPD